MGKVLRCNIAKPMTKLQPGKAVWSAEEWLQNTLKDNTDDILEPIESLEPRDITVK